jgi:DNA-binding LacI/PurR family transcriptional regulator
MINKGAVKSGLGRASAGLCAKLRDAIVSGKLGASGFIPSQRELSADFGVAHTTVRRALKQLIEEGLLVAEPRRGFRVLPRATDPNRGCPLAYIHELIAGEDMPMQPWLLESLRAAAGRRGWSVLAPSVVGREIEEVIADLRSQRSFAAVLNTVEPRVLAAVERWGVPAVVINDQAESGSIDSIVQDGHQAGVSAVRHLLEQGCRRIAWLGPRGKSVHVLERFGGVVAALHNLGTGLPDDLLVWTEQGTQAAQARELLSRADRPDGVVCMWREAGLETCRAARELGIELGRDLHVVGWCPEEQYDHEWLPEFKGGYVPPANTWSVQTMAELALSRLAERRENPNVPALRVKVPVTLRIAEREASRKERG